MKECNWALIQFQTRPVSPSNSPPGGDESDTENAWFLLEEFVPAEYRAALLELGQVSCIEQILWDVID